MSPIEKFATVFSCTEDNILKEKVSRPFKIADVTIFGDLKKIPEESLRDM